MFLFLKGGQVYPVPPFMSSRRPCFFVSPLCLWWLVVVGRCMRGVGVLGGLGVINKYLCSFHDSFPGIDYISNEQVLSSISKYNSANIYI